MTADWAYRPALIALTLLLNLAWGSANLIAAEKTKAVGPQLLESFLRGDRQARWDVGELNASGRLASTDREALVSAARKRASTGNALAGLAFSASLRWRGAPEDAKLAVHEAKKSVLFFQSIGNQDALLADAQMELGHAYHAASQEHQALELYQRALTTRQNLYGPATLLTADAIENVGVAEWHVGNYRTALDRFKAALSIHENMDRPRPFDIGRLQFSIGTSWLKLNRPILELESYGKALAFYEKELEPSDLRIATVHNNMGIVLQSLDRHAEAVGEFERALAIRAHILPANDRMIAMPRYNLGRAYTSLSKYDDAIRQLNSALAIYIRYQATHPELAADAHLELARVHSFRNDFAAAKREIGLAEAALQTKYSAADPRMARIHSRKGRLLQREGKLISALTELDQGLRLTTDPGIRATLLLDKGSVKYELEEFSQALRIYEEALEAFQGTESGPSWQADTINAIGDVYRSLGQHSDALRFYQRSEKLYELAFSRSHPATAQAISDIGDAYRRLRRYDEAMTQFEEARRIYEKTYGRMHTTVADTYDDIGWTWRLKRNYEEASAAYEVALHIRQQVLRPFHRNVARNYINWGVSKSISGDRYGGAVSQLTALAILTALPDAPVGSTRQAYSNLSYDLQALKFTGAAMMFAKLSVNAHQDLRNLNKDLAPESSNSLFEEFREGYRSLVSILIREGLYSEAQFVAGLEKREELMEFTRGQVAAETNSDSVVLMTKAERRTLAEIDKLLVIPQRLKARLARREKMPPKSSTDAARLNAKLTEEFGNFIEDKAVRGAFALFDRLEKERKESRVALLAQERRRAAAIHRQLAKLKDRAVLLQLTSLDDRLHLILTAGRSTIAREVRIERSDLARKVYDAVNEVETKGSDADRKLAELYTFLIEPVEAELRASEAKVILLSLSGFLRYIPFAALSKNGRYLIEDYALALYNPTLNNEFAVSARQDAIGVGFGVTEPHHGFSALPGVAKELEAIFAGQDERGPLAGRPTLDEAFDEAALASALQSRPRYVHIASHFKFSPGRENNSYLLLGTGERLTLAQLRQAKEFSLAGVELITLSACETARSGGSEAEELESLGALAQLSGAAAVMATLWAIADDSTAGLMADFYTGNISEGFDKATALQRAQVAMLRGTSAANATSRGSRSMRVIDDGNGTATLHPYYWAPFILMGNWL